MENSGDLDINQLTSTFGQDSRGVPMAVDVNNGMNGKFNFHLNGLERFYYVVATAPPGYLLTSNACQSKYDNDPNSPFHCDYENAVVPPDERRKRRNLLPAARRRGQVATQAEEVEVGIQQGRSQECVYVDKYGIAQSFIELGIMKLGDMQSVSTEVGLNLSFDSGSISRRLLRNAMKIDVVDDGTIVTTRYLLREEDKKAIGAVTAEILATTLDSRLAEEGVELDSVNPKDVIMANERPSGNAVQGPGSNQLAVAMEIKGHYSPPPNIDFNYIVEDSINRDAATIRRGLRDYNQNCRDQSQKVNEMGFKEEDFNAVVSTSGAARPGRGEGRPANDIGSMNNVFSTACSSEELLPEYFETSLKEIGTVEVANSDGMPTEYVAIGDDGMAPWAMGPVAAITGLIIILMGAFVFRRAIGPRRVDGYIGSKSRTKDIGKDEKRRFGEGGEIRDDGSVDSAFYSDSDEELEETEKERKMRRKRKDKDEEQKGGTSSRSARTKKKHEEGKSKGSSRRSKEEAKLAVSQGSDDTESVGKSSSNSSGDKFDDNEKREHRSSKSKPERKSSSGSGRNRDSERKSKSSSRKGRSKRSGGDNASKVKHAGIV